MVCNCYCFKMSYFLQKTHAYHCFKDDVPEEIKKMRLQEIITTFHSIASIRNKRFIGTHQLILLDKVSSTVVEIFATYI